MNPLRELLALNAGWRHLVRHRGGRRGAGIHRTRPGPEGCPANRQNDRKTEADCGFHQVFHVSSTQVTAARNFRLVRKAGDCLFGHTVIVPQEVRSDRTRYGANRLQSKSPPSGHYRSDDLILRPYLSKPPVPA